MEKNNWYLLTFIIKMDLEEIIIWKFHQLGITSYAFESLLNIRDKTKVVIWLPCINWSNNSRIKLQNSLQDVLEKNDQKYYSFTWNILKEEDWTSSWKKFWSPEKVGKRIVVVPCWLEVSEEYIDQKIIKIDPGAAFGTGSHATTALCLEKIEQLKLSNKKILDIGSGSGILSVAAKSFGAKNIYAIDNDYLAINSTKSNFKLNFGNLNGIKTYLGSFNELLSKYTLKNFDFIFCNILANVIKEIIPDIRDCLKISGEVILSGILSSQKDEILKLLQTSKLEVNHVSSKKDWVCITAQKIL